MLERILFGHPVDHFKGPEGKGFFHKGVKFVHHSTLPHEESAFFRLSLPQKFVLTLIAAIIVSGLIFSFKITIVVLLGVLSLIYFFDLLFNLFLITRSFHKSTEIKVSVEEIKMLDEKSLPTYSIMCPLYHEWKIVPQFVRSMSHINYPKDKLQVMLLLEEDDEKTIQEIGKITLPDYFDVKIVPHSIPKTKPKALNYGLNYATGDMVVIYDAEDVPEKNQLKRAVIAFNNSDDNVKCVQAKLNFYNPRQNILTRVFTAEYSLWFDLVLTGLQSIQAPIPLGGTSNHFRKKDLIELKGWDSFNVTEDADLGMRIVKQGYRTAVMASTTYEEANSNFTNWFGQRTRWIKGYIQTYFVHMRNPQHFIKHWHDPQVITFQLIVGGKVASMLINPIMWTVTILYFVFRAFLGPTIESFFPSPVFYLAIFSTIFGNFLYLYYYMVGCAKRKHYSLIKYAFLVPFYWLAISFAAYIAWFKLIVEPHYWSKTKHGLHIDDSEANNAYTV